MNRRGFILLEVLLGMFLLGIISVTFFPIINSAQNNLYLLETKNDMKYFAETVLERIKAFEFDSENDEYILDMRLKILMERFCRETTAEVELPIFDREEYKYLIKINKINQNENLWKIRVNITSKENSERIKDVVLEAYVPKPKRKR
jgi:type II secretory pathway pseudopilin PulG